MTCNTETAITQEEPENIQRGRSAIVWLKVFVIFSLIMGLFSEYVAVLLEPYANLAEKEAIEAMQTMGISSAITILSFILLIFITCIVIFITLFKCCKWLYINIKTLRKLTSTKFSPGAAVVLTLIPWICGFFDYYIFKDILAQQEQVLKARNAKFVALKPGLLKWIFILTIVFLIPSILYDFLVCRILCLVLLFPFCWLYIKAMNAMIENEKTLSNLNESENP